jgi:LemA protein
MGSIIVLIVLVLIALYVIGLYNGLVRLRNQVRNGWAQIDVQLKRRHDLIPNLVEMVKDYMSYEQETLQKVIQARNMAMSAQGVADTSKAENMLTGALKSLFALVENYPDLKAKIAFARQYYNDSAMRMNNRTEVFPSNIIANAFGFQREQYYEIPEEDKEVPKVDLR